MLGHRINRKANWAAQHAARIIEDWLSEIVLHWDPLYGEPCLYWRQGTHEFLGVGASGGGGPIFKPPEQVRYAHAPIWRGMQILRDPQSITRSDGI